MNRHSAHHSMRYIIATILRKAFDKQAKFLDKEMKEEDIWKHLMLLPNDYVENAIFCDDTVALMNKINIEHGGQEYDDLYPAGIPSSVEITTADSRVLDSGIVSTPGGHSENETVNLANVLQHKFKKLGVMALKEKDLVDFVVKLENIGSMTNEELEHIYECKIAFCDKPIDAPESEEEEGDHPEGQPH